MGFEPRIVRSDDDEPVGGPADSRPLGASRRSAPASRANAPSAGTDRFTSERDDLDLPDDLQELAAQLSADAALLEQRHPARNPADRYKEPLVWRLARGAAAAMLLFGSVWWVARRGAEEPGREADHGRSNASGDATRSRDAAVAATGGAESTSAAAVSARLPEPDATAPSRDAAPVGIAADDGPTEPNELAASGAGLAGDPSRFGRRGGRVAELSFDRQADSEGHDPAPRDRVGMLEAQLAAFEKVIAKLQAEIRRRDQLLVESGELIQSLSAEVQALRDRQSDVEPGSAARDNASAGDRDAAN